MSLACCCLNLQDIPDNLKAEAENTPTHQATHRKELKSPPKDTDSNPLGFYFQKDAYKGGLTGASEDGKVAGPESKPLKYYFTKDIPDDAKRQLAFKAMMKAQMDGVKS